MTAPSAQEDPMETLSLAKELVKVERQIAKVSAILSKLAERKMELLRDLAGR